MQCTANLSVLDVAGAARQLCVRPVLLAVAILAEVPCAEGDDSIGAAVPRLHLVIEVVVLVAEADGARFAVVAEGLAFATEIVLLEEVAAVGRRVDHAVIELIKCRC